MLMSMICAPLAKHPEGPVGDAGHRGDEERVGQLERTDAHGR
jgi:hypothetical protein